MLRVRQTGAAAGLQSGNEKPLADARGSASGFVSLDEFVK
jgi:hypothetical protein